MTASFLMLFKKSLFLFDVGEVRRWGSTLEGRGGGLRVVPREGADVPAVPYTPATGRESEWVDLRSINKYRTKNIRDLLY